MDNNSNKNNNSTKSNNKMFDFNQKPVFFSEEYVKNIENNIESILSKVMVNSKIGNLVGEKFTHDIIMAVFSNMVESIEHTLGSYGEQTLISPVSDNRVFIYPTKDGKQSLDNNRWSDPVPTNIYNLLKNISNHMFTNVGDSTTSGLPIAFRLFKNLYNTYKMNENKPISPAGLGNILDAIKEDLNEVLFNNDENNDFNKQYRRNLDLNNPDEKYSVLSRVGCTAANGNNIIGSKVAEIYKNKENVYESFVTLELNPKVGTEDIIVSENGFELRHGIKNKYFATEEDLYTCRYENPKILMFNGPLMRSDLTVLKKIITGVTRGIIDGKQVLRKEETRPLIIIANSFDPKVEAFALRALKGAEFNNMVIKEVNGRKVTQPVAVPIPIALIPMANMYESDMELYDDLKIAVGAEVLDNVNDRLTINVDISEEKLFRTAIFNKLGGCDLIVSTPQSTLIKGGKGHEKKIIERIHILEEQYKSLHTNEKHKVSPTLSNAMRRRISMLKANTGKILIGGASITEKSSKMEVYDDVTKAISSTIASGGVTLSGNVSITHYLTHFKDEIVNRITKKLTDNKMNVTIGNAEENVKELVSGVVDIFADAFTSSYKIALFNAYRDKDKVNEIYSECIKEKDKAKVFNLMTGNYESIVDFENCNLIVPTNTDSELVYIIVSTVKMLITSSKMLTLAPLSTDWKKLMESQQNGGRISITGSASEYDYDN